MSVKQVSVFIENREGRLEEVTAVLAQNNINIVTFSLADTSEYGMLRMIVSDPDKARQLLKENGFSAMLTEVIAVKVPNKSGMLQTILRVIAGAGCNVEYMYILSTGENASVVIKTSDVEKVTKAMQTEGIEIYTADKVYDFKD